MGKEGLALVIELLKCAPILQDVSLWGLFSLLFISNIHYLFYLTQATVLIMIVMMN